MKPSTPISNEWLQSRLVKSTVMNVRLLGFLLFAILVSGQMAQAQTLVLQLQATNYNATTGVWTDSSGNGNNATATGTKPALVTGVSPSGASAVVFSSSSPLTLASSIPVSSYTVLAYIKPATGAGPYALLGGTFGSFEYRIYNGKQDDLRQSQADLGSENTAMSTSTFSVIGTILTSSGISFRLNGSPDGTNTVTPALSQPISTIGAQSGGGEAFIGSICEIDVYNGVLSPAQILAVETAFTNSYIFIPFPNITAQPANQGTVSGGTASFSVTASGAPTLAYQWQATNSANGSFTNVPNAAPFSGATSSTLTITGATASQALTYQVIITNSYGSVTSSPASLTVADPVISVQPANQSTYFAGAATFTVSAVGGSTLSYQWQTNGGSGWGNLGNGVQNGSTISGATSSALTISGVTTYWAGLTYQVVVSDTAGSVTSSPAATLTQNVGAFSWNTTSGTWDTSSANWTGVNTIWADGNSATFNNTNTVSTITLSGSRTAAAITVGYSANNNANFSFTGGTSLTADSFTLQGSAVNGGSYSGNPTSTINVPNVSIGGDVAVGRANLVISGGNFSANRIVTTSGSGLADWADVTISGGTVWATNGVVGNVGTTATFQLDLNGGTLYTPSLTVADREGQALLNWNGGTVVATADANPFVTLYGGSQNTYVGNGGAIINTFDGTTAHSVTITPALKQSGVSTGGLTKLGLGTLTLAGANTYTGNTVISNGTLALSGSGAIGSSANINVASGATFDVSAVSYTLGGSQSLSSSGTVNGSVNTTSGSKIYAGGDATGVYATNTFNNDLNTVTGSAIYLDLGTTAGGSNDLVNVAGTLTLNNTVFHLKAPSTSVNMSTTSDYVLATASAISGSPAGVPTWDVSPLNAGNFTVTTSGTQVLLHYSASGIPPAITGQPNSTNVLVGTTVTISGAAGGTAPLSYQWQAGPVGGPYTNLINGGQVSGVTTSQLTITNVSLNWAMAYQLVVTNAYGSATSSAANLNVNNAYYLHFTPTFLALGTGPITPNNGVTSISGAGLNIGDLIILDAIVVDTNAIRDSDAWGAIELNQQGGFLGLTASQLGVLVRTAGSFGQYWVNGSGQGNLAGTSGAAVTNRVRIELTATSAGSTASMNYVIKTDQGLTGTFNSIVSGTGVNFSGNTIALTFGAQNDGMLFTEYVPTNSPPIISASASPSGTIYAQTAVTFTANVIYAPSGTTYQWQTDGGNGGISFTNIPGASGTNYVLNTTTLVGTYQYQLVATASTGTTISAPPISLTVLAVSAPVLTTDTTANPNVTQNYAGNTQSFSAMFSGTTPIAYQWQFSTNADGSNAVNIPGATTTNLVINSLQLTNTGYYSLFASNGIAPYVASSSWTPLTVVVQTTNNAVFVWSNPVSCTNLNASQILLGPGGTFFEAAAFNGGSGPISVVAGGQTFVFTNDGSTASVQFNGGIGGNALSPYTTGDASFDSALVNFAFPFIGGSEWIQLKNLVPGQSYMVQLFAWDNRNGPTNGVGIRRINFQDPNNATDVSKTFTQGSLSYVVGTFVATDTTQIVQQNQLDGQGNVNAVVVFTLNSSVNTDPATAHFAATVSGAPGSQAMNFTWAPDHLGWQLYTNSVGLTATGSWFPVAGSSTVTNTSITINPAKTNVFFQLRYP